MSGSLPIDTATIAFRRVLAEATAGEQARVDALVVLAQRTLFIATWPAPNQVARTLTNSDGETALPLFTGLDALEATATRFGWRDPDGSLQYRELGAREALRHALARGVHFVVLDIGTAHSVEFSRAELEPLLQLQSGRSGSGPFAATGEPQAQILDAVRRSTSRPPGGSSRPASSGTPAAYGGAAISRRPASVPLTGDARPPSVRPLALSANDNLEAGTAPLGSAAPVVLPAGRQQRVVTREVPTGKGAPPIPPHANPRVVAREVPTSPAAQDEPRPPNLSPTRDDIRKLKALGAPRLELSDSLRDGIAAALRAFPEVEWACMAADESEIPVVGVRVDPSFLNRVADITDAILDSAEKQGVALQVLLLNNVELVKSAHRNGHAFYPWRK